MSRTDRLIDDIDALVDEQMRGGEPRNGFDYGDPNNPKCWHCGDDWHGLAITERMRSMRYRLVVDDDYRYDEDDSPVICPGSRFIGPRAPTAAERRIQTLSSTFVEMAASFDDLFDMSSWQSLGYIDSDGPTFSPEFADGGLVSGWSMGSSTWTIEVGDNHPTPEPESRLDDRGRPRPPRPSTTPPMWADVPNRSRRRR